MNGREKQMKKRILAAFLLGLLCFAAAGCGGSEKYPVDYHGQKRMFKGAQDRYEPGASVELKYDMIASDTDYSFHVDADDTKTDFVWQEHAYVIRFTMPDRPIEVRVEKRNNMTINPAARP